MVDAYHIETQRENANEILRAFVAAVPITLLFSYFTNVFSLSPWRASLCLGFVALATTGDWIYGVTINLPNNWLGVRAWEHADWGLLLITLSKFFSSMLRMLPFCAGVYLLVAEAFQTDPFSHGEGSFPQTVAVVILMAAITTTVWLL